MLLGGRGKRERGEEPKILVEVKRRESEVLSQLHPTVRWRSAGGPWVFSAIRLELFFWFGSLSG